MGMNITDTEIAKQTTLAVVAINPEKERMKEK